ncbi:MAG: hypothetical protein RIB84_20795 [Sneathiellaceae bacterium]
MKFSANRLYVEQYLKCDNCGILLYEGEPQIADAEAGKKFCSDWCVDWYRTETMKRFGRDAG